MAGEQLRVASAPFMPGIRQSITTTSGAKSATRARQSSAETASPTTSTPSRSARTSRSILRAVGLSSTTNTLTPAAVPNGDAPQT
jgi:hypothetical protein